MGIYGGKSTYDRRRCFALSSPALEGLAGAGTKKIVQRILLFAARILRERTRRPRQSCGASLRPGPYPLCHFCACPGKRRSGRGNTVLGGEKPRKTASGVEFVRGEFEQQRAKFAERFSSFPRLPGLQALEKRGRNNDADHRCFFRHICP